MADDDFDDDATDELTEVMVEVRGLSLYTHHGVGAAEREVGQRILVDLRIEVSDCDATVTDEVEDTIDYGEVCTTVALVAQQRSYKTLLPVEEVGVELWRQRGESEDDEDDDA